MANIIKVYACDTIFHVEKSKLEKSGFFKHQLSFNSLSSIDLYDKEYEEIKTDLEPEIFQHIVFHMKYVNMNRTLTQIELEKINLMADYLLYGPLMKNRVIKPETLKMCIMVTGGEWRKNPVITIQSNNMDYIYHCMRNAHPDTFYINKIENKVGNDFLYVNYFNFKGNFPIKTIDRYYGFLSEIKLMQHDLCLSIGHIEVIFVDSKRYAYVTFLGDDLHSSPCNTKFKKLPHDMFEEKKEVCDPAIIIRDYTPDDFPIVYYSEFSAMREPIFR
jgi:hypothetical protein